jgi:hypothetical protein
MPTILKLEPGRYLVAGCLIISSHGEALEIALALSATAARRYKY